jgi:RHS repeat-associated protein
MKLRLLALALFFANMIYAQSFHDTQGKLDITSGGQAVFTLPIAMPPSIQNVGPKIDLTYNSGQLSGIGGNGWNISGLSYINRTATRLDIEGYIDGVDFDDNDRLAFNGQRMLLKTTIGAGVYWADGSEYETEIQSNNKIELKGTGNAIYFIVTSADGSRSWYGNYGGVAGYDSTAYYIVRYEDTNGNFITYNYTKTPGNGLYVSEINFSANLNSSTTPLNKIKFNYVVAKRKENAYVKGIKVEKAELLKNIEVFTNGLLFRRYELTHDYDTQLGYERVTKVQEFNNAGQGANPILFNHIISSTTNQNVEVQTNYDQYLTTSAALYPGDFDGDGNMDLMNNGKIFTNLFQGGSAISTPNPTLGRPITTLSADNKLNQFQSVLSLSNIQQQSLTFNVKNLDKATNTMVQAYSKTVDFPSYGSCFSNCPNISCDGTFFVNASNKYYEGDFNGDGISEILMCYYPEHKQYENVPIPLTGSGSEDAARLPDPMQDCKYTFTVSPIPNAVRLLDLNPNSSTTLGTKGYVDFPFPDVGNIYGELTVADFNGDGKSDIMALREDKSYTILGFKQLTVAPWVVTEKLGEGVLSDYEKTKVILFGDFNGDTKTDVIIPVAKKNSNWVIYYSNPKADAGEMFEKETHNITEYYPDTGTPGTAGAEYTTFEVFKNYYAIDANKDGKSDLVMFKVDYSKKEWWQYRNFDTKWKVYTFVNNIGNTTAAQTFSKDYESASEHSSGNPGIPMGLASNFRFKGMNKDFVVLRGSFDGNPGYAVYTKFTKNVSEDCFLRSVSQSAGAIANSIEYKELTPTSGQYGNLNDFYSSTNSLYYPYVEVKQSPQTKLVYRLTNVAMGVTKKQDFKYHGLVIHLEGLGMMGFMKTARSAWYTNPTAKRLWSVTEMDPLKRAAVVRNCSLLLDTDFAFATSYSNLVQKKDYVYSQSTDPNTKRYVGLLDKEILTDYLTNVITEKETKYTTDYFLPEKITAKNYLGATLQGTYVTDMVYDTPSLGVNYSIGKLVKKTGTSNAYNDVKFNVEKYTYTNNRITKTEKNVSKDPTSLDDVTLIEDVEYFSDGNVKKKTLRATGTAAANSLAPRSTEYTYDATNRFVKTTKDPELSVVTNDNFDPLYGVVLKQTNHLGQSTTSMYDSWGKRDRITDFLGKKVDYTYVKTGNLYVTTETKEDGSVSMVESDVLSRLVRKGAKDINGVWSYVKTEYDEFNRKLRESEPYTTSPALWKTHEYDDYSRNIKIINSTGRIYTLDIAGLTTTTYDEVLSKKTIKNANGHTISAEDNPGGIITYKYDALGNMLESDYGGVKVKVKYDNWGRKSELEDTSAGVYKYTYNAFGELLTDETPKGITSYTLDPVGKPLTKRIVGKTTNDRTDILNTYTYDTTFKWLKKINVVNVYDGNGSFEYFYDSVTKQLNKTIEITPKAKFTKQLDFDGFGRVEIETSIAEVISPSKASTVVVKNVYKNGQLWRKLDGAGLLLWQVNTVNAKGLLTGATLGNGIDITNTYDNYGFLTQSKHDKTGTTPINVMTLNNIFDVKLGNLKERYTSLFDFTEKFEYDTLDRLVTWNGANQNLLTLPFNTTVDGFTFNGTSTSGSVTNSAGTLKVILKSPWVAAQRVLPTGFMANDIVNVKAAITNKTGTSGVIVNAIMVETDPSDSSNWAEFYVGPIENGSFDKNYTVSNYVCPNPLLTIKFVVDESSPESSNGGGMVFANSTFYVDNFKIEKASVLTQQYDDRGRITQNNIGTYTYTDSLHPYQNTTIKSMSAEEKTYYGARGALNVTYNAFKSPIEIEESGKDKLSFGYNGMMGRSTMYYGNTNTNVTARPYQRYYSADGTMEVTYTVGGAMEFLTYIGGDAYTAPMVVKSDGGANKNNFYLHRDYLGSIVAITNNSGVIVEKRHFDAWGNVMKVQDGAGNNLTKLTFFDRGYTGHEHLQSVGLIHMNGRLYDPKLHRFLQPDNYVQEPYNTQNYNRYGYVLNNPLKFNDPSGEAYSAVAFVAAVAVSMIVGVLSAVAVEAPITFSSTMDSFAYAAISAGGTAAIGEATSLIVGTFLVKATVQMVSHGVFQGVMYEMQGGKFCTGFYTGAIASLAGSVVEYFSFGVDVWGPCVTEFGLEAEKTYFQIAFGTVMGGIGARISGGNFWQGAVTGLFVSGLNHYMHRTEKMYDIIVLEDFGGANNAGHQAIAFENRDGTLHYVSKDGAVGGGVYGDVTFTIGDFKNVAAINDYYSALKHGLRYDVTAVYRGNRSQIVKGINAAESVAKVSYSLIGSSCNDVVAAGLNAAFPSFMSYKRILMHSPVPNVSFFQQQTWYRDHLSSFNVLLR